MSAPSNRCGRSLEPTLVERLAQSPVAIVSGMRQVGKTTLVQSFAGAGERKFLTLEHLQTRIRATSAPHELVEDAERMTIDEVQLVPDVLHAVKHSVDRDRRNGRFLLTGSANLLLLKSVGESLAGRALYSCLRPMSEREKRGEAVLDVWGALMDATDARDAQARLPKRRAFGWKRAVVEGGLPRAALAGSDAERSKWFEGYVDTYVQRDVRELAQVSDLAGFGRLLQVIALRTGGLLNQANVARDAVLPRSTAQRWMSFLEVSYLVTRLPPFFESRIKRLVKSAKVFPGDTGLALHVAGIADESEFDRVPNVGVWLEALVLNDLLVWRETAQRRPEVFHFRTEDAEIDFVVEQGQRLLPIEVKVDRVHRFEDAGRLDAFCAEFGDRAPVGVLLFDGPEPAVLTRRVLAVPIGCVL